MTANRRMWAGRRPAAEEPLPAGTSRSASRPAPMVDWRVSVPGVPAIVAVARQLVRAALEHSPRADDLELVTSELVTNAICHTPSGEAGRMLTVRIQSTSGWARIEVRDLGSASWREPPATATGTAAEDECGRGLVIVGTLADRAGHEPVDGGQISWAEIRWDDARSSAHRRT
jgi:anti-sigma regulatory factor (Ser/Thr protein kinase)